MAANTSPIFSLTPKISWGAAAITAANTAVDGTGTVTTVYTAGSNGAFINRVRFKAVAAFITTATVARVYINNGSANSTPGNNVIWDEITLPAITPSLTAATPPFDVLLNLAIPAGYVINVIIGTAQAGGAGWYASCAGGDY